MADPLITLTTDFGDRSPYVAVLKGVILSTQPAARVLDLSHRIPPQDVRHGGYFLATCVPYFPHGTIHLAVVDPGVGTERAALCVRAGGQWLIGPDNGLFAKVIERLGPPEVWRLTESRFWRSNVSATFHGRDVFAPVAAHLASGVTPDAFGKRSADWVRLPTSTPVKVPGGIRGQAQFIDDFGNIITDIPFDWLPGRPTSVCLACRPVAEWRWARTYGEAPPGTLVVLSSSDGFLELARVDGAAAEFVGAAVGDPVELRFD